LILALDGGEWTASRPYRFTLGETAPARYPSDVRLGGPQKGPGRVAKLRGCCSIQFGNHSPRKRLIEVEYRVVTDAQGAAVSSAPEYALNVNSLTAQSQMCHNQALAL
jgi:hypothetical protein